MLQVLEAAAVSVLVTQGDIFRPLREHGPKLWRELVNCPLCLGWWIGAAGAAGDVPSYSELTLRICWGTAWHVFSAGALAGCAALFYRRVTEYWDVATFQLDLQTRVVRDKYELKEKQPK